MTYTLDDARQWCADNFDLLHTEAVMKSLYAIDVLGAYLADRKYGSHRTRDSYFVKKFNQYMQAREARCHV